VNAPTGRLFRQEVLEHRADRLHGEVSIAIPISWQIIGFTLLAALATALVFLFSASYARIETVSGAVVLDRGVASIVPSRPGIVADIPAREGQHVRPGQPLVQIRSEEDLASGRTAPRRIRDALEQQDQRLASQTALMMNAAGAEQSRLAAEIAGLGQEIASLEAQIAEQRRLVEVAANEYREVQGVATKGFISRRDLEARESALIGRRQQLAQLQQARAAKSADMAEAQRAIAQAGAAAQAQAAGVQSSRAELVQRLAEVETAQGYTLTSPVAGTVTAVTARVGQAANQQQPLMVVMPADATPRAELYVPTSAAGFLAVGQDVRLAVDAFPYQRFGTVKARVVQISSVAIPKVTAEGTAVPVYLVTAELSEPSVVAFGLRQPLLPGMTLSARIVTERQSLFEWLFEPLYAVMKR
jgi:membrane fusion protein